MPNMRIISKVSIESQNAYIFRFKINTTVARNRNLGGVGELIYISKG